MLGRTDSAGRLVTILVVFGVLASGLVVRLGYWQIAQRDSLVESARRQISEQIEVPSARGTIYDRSGTVVLAATLTRNRLVVSAERMTPDDQDRMVGFLTEMLSLDAAGAADIRSKLGTARPYLVLARDLSPEKTEAIRSAAADRGIVGISFETDFVRAYPQAGGAPGSSLAAQLLGFVNRQGQGQYGVEQYYQDALAGTPNLIEADKDANGQPLPDTQRTVQAGSPGRDLRLTIDAGLQLAIEQEVMAAKIADVAGDVSAVVMDPYTGEVYAEASYPSYDANDYATVAASDPSRFVDPIVSEIYEPGSVFKLLTTIAALERGSATLSTKFRDMDTLVLDGGRASVQDADHRGMGTLRLQDAVAYSRNVVLAQVALGLARSVGQASKALHAVWTRFGFGSLTGIDLAGEVRGLVNDPAVRPWRQIDLANGAFGQGVAVTPIQLATAYAAMVNGGVLVQPHVVAAIGSTVVNPSARGSVLAPAMSPLLQGLMHHVLTIPWYKQPTLVPGYWMGGKTGTAQVWDAAHQRWFSDRYNFSFIGFIGRQKGHPDLIVAIQIKEAHPRINALGQLVLAITSNELYRRIATDAISTPVLLPALPATRPASVPVTTPSPAPSTSP